MCFVCVIKGRYVRGQFNATSYFCVVETSYFGVVGFLLRCVSK